MKGAGGAMARIKVLYFAALREDKGRAEETVEVDEGTTLAELYAQLFADSPLREMPVAYARNLTYSDGSDRVESGDEVSFLPPLGGG
jgi:molybdopterin synthase sulfur carrier subunit